MGPAPGMDWNPYSQMGLLNTGLPGPRGTRRFLLCWIGLRSWSDAVLADRPAKKWPECA